MRRALTMKHLVGQCLSNTPRFYPHLLWMISAAMLLATHPLVAQWRKVTEQLVVTNPDFDACHASTMALLPNGEVGLAFFAGRYEGHKQVNIRWAVKHADNTWTHPLEIANGMQTDSSQYPCWNPVLFSARDGRLHLYYKVGPNPRQWWGMVQYSANNGLSWSQPKKLPAGILGPIKNKPVQLNDGSILSPSSEETDSTWRVHVEKWDGGNQRWRKIPVNYASHYKVIQPSLLHHGGATWQMICRSNQDSLVAAWSYDNGETWTAYSKLPLQNPNTGADAITLRNGTHLLVYNPGVQGKEWFNNRNKLHVAESADGITWKDVMVLENGNQEEYSYPSLIEHPNGEVHISYTYNRKNIKYWIIAPVLK